jgi:metal-responsive CopG/Arc/MetJ family transcriptional regulator
MSIRTTVTLDEDVLERVRDASRERGSSFRDTLNELLRLALVTEARQRKRTLVIQPFQMGYREGLNYDDIEALLEVGEGKAHR